MTTNDILSFARRILQDTKSPFRWSTAELKHNLEFGIRELNKLRPETRYVTDSTGIHLVDYIELPLDDNEQMVLNGRYCECLAYYVVYLAYMNDSTDTVNQQLAEVYLGKFSARTQN